MSRGTDFHSTEIMLVHDGTTVSLTQYGVLQDNTLATFDADISGDNVRLKCTPRLRQLRQQSSLTEHW